MYLYNVARFLEIFKLKRTGINFENLYGQPSRCYSIPEITAEVPSKINVSGLFSAVFE